MMEIGNCKKELMKEREEEGVEKKIKGKNLIEVGRGREKKR